MTKVQITLWDVLKKIKNFDTLTPEEEKIWTDSRIESKRSTGITDEEGKLEHSRRVKKWSNKDNSDV
jgi:hypothetical protein